MHTTHTIAALSDTERKRLRTSARAVFTFVALIGAALAPLVYALAYHTNTPGESIFTVAIIVIGLLGMIALYHFGSASRRDLQAGTKHLTRGRISRIDRKQISSGILFYVRVGQTLATDPLLHNAEAPLGTLGVGQPVEIATLPQSGRTLYVRRLD